MNEPVTADRLAPLRDFVVAMTRLVDKTSDEASLLAEGRKLLATLVAGDDWLPDACAVADARCYRQYLLHADPLGRFSVVSFVWGPGQQTPVHDHTVWGLVGMLRGAEHSQRWARKEAGRMVPVGEQETLHPGEIDAVSPSLGDWHVVSNALADKPSISIHVYGANIGAVRRHVYNPDTGATGTFVSGYSSDVIPNIWSCPAALVAEAADR